jgi:hypothetical protein
MIVEFDAAEARRRRDRALAVVVVGKDDWIKAAKWAVYEIAKDTREFTTDAVWASGLPEPPSGSSRALGPVMLAASRAGVVQITDRTRPTTKKLSHAQPLRVWTSNIYQPH